MNLYPDIIQGLPAIPVLLKDGSTGILVKEPIHYETPIGNFTVPEKFLSDGCSLPRIVWRVIGHPFDMRYLREALLHDYLYRTQLVTRAQADRLLYDMTKGKICWLRRQAIYRGLQMGGWVAWNKHAKALKARGVSDAPVVAGSGKLL